MPAGVSIRRVFQCDLSLCGFVNGLLTFGVMHLVRPMGEVKTAEAKVISHQPVLPYMMDTATLAYAWQGSERKVTLRKSTLYQGGMTQPDTAGFQVADVCQIPVDVVTGKQVMPSNKEAGCARRQARH